MKPLRCSIVVFFLISFLSFSVYALVPVGTWVAPGQFQEGTWEEILKGGGEGKKGNEITAESANYIFKGAILVGTPELLSSTADCDSDAIAKYKTTYHEGTLTLITKVPGSPWFINGNAGPYIIDLGETVVYTCKYQKDQMSFTLESNGVFQFPAFYEAVIKAEYRLGTPTLNVNNPPDVPSTISGSLDSAEIKIIGPAPAVMDIKPGSCPNPINVKSRGVIPMAILGGKDLNIRAIDYTSIYLTNGLTDSDGKLITVAPIRLGIEDVGGPYPFDPLMPREDRMDCGVSTADSFMDLTLKFSTQEVVEAFDLMNEEDRSTQEWFLLFSLKDPNGKIIKEMVGSDVVWILNKTDNGKNGPSANRLKRNIR
jgi:hypothetical protein